LPQPGALPVPFGRFDVVSVGVTLGGLLAWVIWPVSLQTGSLLLLAGVGQGVRMLRWRGWRVWASPLVLMLHMAFAFVPAGLVALGLAALDVWPAMVGLHLLGIGGFGGMTIAVMMRASLGHTGRALHAGPALTLAFACVAMAAVVRVAVAFSLGLWIAATLWTVGFAIFAWRFAPVLSLPNPARR
jgi:uncharacterized protein involved in response to NO